MSSQSWNFFDPKKSQKISIFFGAEKTVIISEQNKNLAGYFGLNILNDNAYFFHKEIADLKASDYEFFTGFVIFYKISFPGWKISEKKST